MSTVVTHRSNQIQPTTIDSGTLLEHLYTYFSLNQLQVQLDCFTNEAILHKWGVSQSEYHDQVSVAIEYVKRE